jgi:hypothetical protein
MQLVKPGTSARPTHVALGGLRLVEWRRTCAHETCRMERSEVRGQWDCKAMGHKMMGERAFRVREGATQRARQRYGDAE